MTSKSKVRGIVSLSSASMALLQGTISSSGEPLNKSSVDLNNAPNGQIPSKTEKLILAPVHHEELVRLYADHSSHASHSSHSSHYSGTSGSDDSSVAATPVPAAPPVTYPTYTQPQPSPVVSAPNTNTVTQKSASDNLTNTLSVTNTPAGEAVTPDKTELIAFLKKRAAEGSADAQYSLADYYLKGRDGVKQDTEAGKLLLEMSASQGNKFSKDRLEELKQEAKDSEKNGK